MKPIAGTRPAKTKTFLKKTSAVLLLAVFLLVLFSSPAQAVKYIIPQIKLTLSTNASVYRVLHGDSVTINAHGSSDPILHADTDSVSNFGGGLYSPVNGFYIANVGQGCTPQTCGWENESSRADITPFDLSLTLDGTDLPQIAAGQTVASRQILVFPVIDLEIATDVTFFTGSSPITIEVYSSPAALAAAAQAACTANPNQVGCNADGTVSDA